MTLGEGRRKGVRSSEGPHSQKWFGHADKGVVSRKAERKPTEGRTGEVPHAGVHGEFVRKQVPPDGKWEEPC